MIKDLFSDLFNQKVIDAIKAIFIERLWLLALSMKDKSHISECGSILSKTAADDEYKWGLRFYVLLIECFHQWTIYTDDQDFKQKWNRIKESVPIVEDEFYYPQSITQNFLNHSKVDALLGEQKLTNVSSKKLNPENISQNLDKKKAEPENFNELKNTQNRYFDVLFAKAPNVASICENHMVLQSLFDAKKSKLLNQSLNSGQKSDINFYQKFGNIHVGEDIEKPKGISRLRQNVCQLLVDCYGTCPPEYEQMLGQNSRPTSQTKKSEPSKNANVFLNFSDIENGKKETLLKNKPQNDVKMKKDDYEWEPKSSHKKKENFDYQLDEIGKSDNEIDDYHEIDIENKELRRQKEKLYQEVEMLKDKEKSLNNSIMQRSDFRLSQKIDASPEILIEEINRKNHEYEALQGKYQSLINQMNGRMRNDLDRSISGISRIDRPGDSLLDWNPKSFDISGVKESKYLQSKNSYSNLRNNY